MTPEQAIRIIALHVITTGAEGACEDGWGNYPELGEGDWESVVQTVKEIARWPEAAEYRAAYAVLEARANDAKSTFYKAEEK